MFSKFELWQYRSDHNCWDFVREWLIDNAGVPACDVPKFGICPNDKGSMTKAAVGVECNFTESKPVDHAIACQYRLGTLWHVGIVYNGMVWHVGSKTRFRRDKIDVFESMYKKVRYKIHKCLL